ncbi:hypothetical protein EsDP_00005921 [Epichloe bromicola]|uniref:Large ribosomal subunit protein mL50 n=1 Tax=Epichloe bromicola TaxID=79588 RepID=A0ABQ0CW38_9HYPO
MARISRMRGLVPLQLTAPAPLSTRPSFAACRAISTTCATRGKNTEWVRGKLWKGEAPGPEDPYTQRFEVEPEGGSNLPEEALHLRRSDKTPAAVLNSRLTLPPRRTEAASERELKSADPSYVPATDAQGLEAISTLETWWDQEGHWGEESVFKGFGSSEKVADKNVMEVYLRQSVVEALSLQETGSFSAWSTKKWREVSRSELDQILAAEVLVQDGRALLKGDSSSISKSLVSEADEVDAAAKVAPEEAREMVRAWGASWKELVLDEQLKFAIRKRLYQLTGTLIPDAKLGAARTVKHVLTLIAKQPKPAKLAELLERRSDVQQLANVKVHSRKIGPVEKETSVGRWKVIEEELTKRGLPVTGTTGLSKNKERDWISGKI